MAHHVVKLRDRSTGDTVEYESVKRRDVAKNMSEADWVAQINVWPEKLVAQNSKLRRTDFYQWTIPALTAGVTQANGIRKLVTCPGAGKCAEFCYAQQGGYVFKASMVSHTRKLQAYLSDPHKWAEQMKKEIRALHKSGKLKAFRIHDSGDFFGKVYLHNWLGVIRACPEVQFYCYTKMVPFFRGVDLPANLTVVFSYGGKWDDQINTQQDRHSKVFSSHKDMTEAGYVDATETDAPGADPAVLRVGLVYHGNEGYRGRAV